MRVGRDVVAGLASALLGLAVASCAPRVNAPAPDDPASTDATTGRLAGPPSALRPGVASLEPPPRAIERAPATTPADPHAGHANPAATTPADPHAGHAPAKNPPAKNPPAKKAPANKPAPTPAAKPTPKPADPPADHSHHHH